MAGGINVRSNMGPVQVSSPKVNTYEYQGAGQGQDFIRGQFSGGPAFSIGAGKWSGLADFGNDLEKFAQQLNQIKATKDNTESIEAAQEYENLRRRNNEEIAKLEGKNAMESARPIANKFHDDMDKTFIEGAKSNKDRQYREAIIHEAYQSDQSYSFKVQQKGLETWNEDVWNGQVYLAEEAISNDPDSWQLHLTELQDKNAALHPGRDLTASNGILFETAASKATDSYIASGNLDGARTLINRIGGKDFLDDRIASIVANTSAQLGVDENLVRAVIHTESNGNPNAVGPQTRYGKAKGLMQLIPSTARELNVTDPTDPEQNVRGGVTYLQKQLSRFGNQDDALIAYNWGPDNAAKWIAEGRDISKIPPETKKYVQKVNAAMQSFSTSNNEGLWISPIDGDYKVTSGLGPRNAPLPGASTDHNGWDIPMPVGTELKAMAQGTIEKIVPNAGNGGFTVGVRADDGTYFGFAHLSGAVTGLKVGQRVAQGETIAYSGNTGNSTGPHLHLTMRSKDGARLDPGDFIGKNGGRGFRTNTALAQTLSGKLDAAITERSKAYKTADKATLDGATANLENIKRNGVPLDGYEIAFQDGVLRGNITESDITSYNLSKQANLDFYDAVNAPNAKFQSIDEIKKVLEEKWKLPEGTTVTPEVLKQESVYASLLKDLDSEKKALLEQPMDYTQTSVDSAMKHIVTPPSMTEKEMRVEVAHSIASNRGNLSIAETNSLPALTTDEYKTMKADWDNTPSESRYDFIQTIKSDYGKYSQNVLNQLGIGFAGEVSTLTSNQSVINAYMYTAGMKESDLTATLDATTQTNVVKAEVNALINTGDDSPDTVLGTFTNLFKITQDPTMISKGNEIAESVRKASYYLVQQGMEPDEAVELAVQDYEANYNVINDLDLAVVSVPTKYNSISVYNGLEAIQTQLGKTWDDTGMVFIDAGDDKGVYLHSLDGVVRYFTYSDISLLDGTDVYTRNNQVLTHTTDMTSKVKALLSRPSNSNSTLDVAALQTDTPEVPDTTGSQPVPEPESEPDSIRVPDIGDTLGDYDTGRIATGISVR